MEVNEEKPTTWFDYIYMFVMVIYMAQATPETSRMVTELSGNPIPLFLPIILTYVLCTKNPISFRSKKLLTVLGIYGLWAMFSLLKYRIFTTSEISFHLFMIYAIVIAYVHNQVYGYRILGIYEKIIVWFCKVSLILWLLSISIPQISSFFRIFQEIGIGNNVIYIYTWIDPERVPLATMRNAGCSWEPGRFAIMVTLAVFCNLCQNGIKFRNNSNIWWLLTALISTMSTTGIVTALALYSVFSIKRFNLKSALIFLFVMLPIIYGIFQLDFMSDKLHNRFERAQDVSYLKESFEWNKKTRKKGAYEASIDRLESIPFEWMNLKKDPILGYSRNFEHSYFRTHLTSNYQLANGLVKIPAMYGIFLGTFFFVVLFISSKRIAEDSFEKRNIGLVLVLCMSAVSYQVLSIPIFTTFWFYGLFSEREVDIEEYIDVEA